jgi:serine phosphatase RsbU (regulator of sigma subunit)
MGGDNPANRLREVLADSSSGMMSRLKSLVDPAHSEDDVTIFLVKRKADSAPSGVRA